MAIQIVAAGPISLEDLYRGLEAVGRRRPDAPQHDVVSAPPDEALFVVAGPGTGKTTALTIRILKLVLVDGVPPRGVLATTFTKKAAAELRSRVLGWGFRLADAMLADPSLTTAQKDALRAIDLNQIWTGTIDSLCEQILRDFRPPGTQPPILADEFVAKTLLLREGLLASRRFESEDLNDVLIPLHTGRPRGNGGNPYNYHVGTKTNLLRTIWDRRFQDQVDWNAFLAGGPPSEAAGRQIVGDALADYRRALNERLMIDFALLEQEVLARLEAGRLGDFTRELRVILVDEYQDTNLLQESLYFELASACDGALTIVGDDDQSLYRFRGATVELFSNFAARYEGRFGRTTRRVFLSNNYRSSQTIVDFVNAYATLDRGYQTVRVTSKPALAPRPGAPAGSQVVGMFRPTIDDLGRDLARLIQQVFRGSGVRLPDGTTLIRDVVGGDVGDCALLCSSPAEVRATGTARLPGILRQELGQLSPPISVFNPRGEDFTSIPIVASLGGLLLKCLDPDERLVHIG